MSIASTDRNIFYRSVSTVTGLFSSLLEKLGLKKTTQDPEAKRQQLRQIHHKNTTIPSEASTSLLEKIIGLEKNFYAGSPFSRVPLQLNDFQTMQHKANIEELDYQTGPGRPLKAFWLKPKTSSMQTFVVLSGIRSSAKYKLPAVAKLTEANIPVIIGNYTGVGSSYGLNINHDTITSDAKKLIENALNKDHKLGVIGHSLGSAVSARTLAQLSETRAGDLFGDIVMVSPWNKFNDVINTYPGPWLKPLGKLLSLYSDQILHNKESNSNVWDTGTNLSVMIRNIAQYLEKNNISEHKKLRIHLFHGTHDSVVRIEEAETLLKSIQEQLQRLPDKVRKHFEITLCRVQDGDHFSIESEDPSLIVEQSRLPISEILHALNNK